MVTFHLEISFEDAISLFPDDTDKGTCIYGLSLKKLETDRLPTIGETILCPLIKSCFGESFSWYLKHHLRFKVVDVWHNPGYLERSLDGTCYQTKRQDDEIHSIVVVKPFLIGQAQIRN